MTRRLGPLFHNGAERAAGKDESFNKPFARPREIRLSSYRRDHS
jgi:hypothetical protein